MTLLSTIKRAFLAKTAFGGKQKSLRLFAAQSQFSSAQGGYCSKDYF
jgi:hypothetical protein